MLLPEGQRLSANQISLISIDGLGITTSVFEKQTSAIVEFYIRFWCQPHRRNLHVVLHQATEFRPNRSTRCENMTSYPFLKISAATAKYCFRFRICWRFWRFGLIFTPLFGKFLGHIFPIWRHPLSWAPKGPVVGGNTSFEHFVDVTAFKRSKSISKPNFVDISQFTAAESYKYFRFGKINVRHIGILLPVSISTICHMSFCIRLPYFVHIGPFTAEIWRDIDLQDGSRGG